MALNLYMSNNLENLFEKMSDIFVNREKMDLFEEKYVIVQNEGLIRWLSLKFAEKFQVASGIRFFTPKSFIVHFFQEKNLLNEKDVEYYQRNSLVFKIFKAIQEENFDELKEYMKNDDGRKLAQLSVALADVFDQYFVYRPEYFLTPDKIESNWQRELFKKIVSQDVRHVTELILDDTWKDKYRKNIFLFGVSVLPPIFVYFFSELSHLVDVNFFVINPSKDFWFDSLSNLQKLMLQERSGLQDDYLLLSDSNPILINNGRLVQHFFKILYENNQPHEFELFEEINDNTLLSRLQKAVLNNQKDMDFSKDESVQVHSFHNRWREIEGVYNYILHILEKDREICLEDVVVMCPHIDEYVPYIEGVFGTKGIDYNISDTVSVNHDFGLQAFFYLLENLRGDINANDFLGILEFDAIREKFGIDVSTFQAIKQLVGELNLIWGIDKDELKEFPNMHFLNTFEYCAKRVLYGYFDNTPGKLVDETLVFEKLFLSNAEILGKMLFLIDKIRFFEKRINEKENIGDFVKITKEIAATFLDEKYVFTTAFNYFLSELGNFSEDDTKITFQSFLVFAKHIASISRNTVNFLRGGVTFCEMVPLRSIPFKVVCLLGMNDDEFPRAAPKYEFDEILKKPRIGDRDVKMSDRLLFLETVLAAKKFLYISFIGRDLKRNKKQNPSIMVAELVDFLNLNVIEHPMHSHNIRYFSKGSIIKNYDTDDFEVANALLNRDKKTSKFELTSEPIFENESIENIELDELVKFFKNPVKYFFVKNGIFLDTEFDELREKEDVALDNLKTFLIKKWLFSREIDEKVLEYSGILPHGKVGKYYKEKTQKDLIALEKGLKKIGYSRDLLKEGEVFYEGKNYSLTGSLRYLDDKAGLILIDFGKEKCDKIAFRIETTIYLACLNKNECFYLSGDTVFKIRSDYPNDFLDKIVDAYNYGISNPVYFLEKKDLAALKDYDEEKFKNGIKPKIKNYKFGTEDKYLAYYTEKFRFSYDYLKKLFELNDFIHQVKFNCEKV